MATEAFPVSHHDEHRGVNVSEMQFFTLVIVQLQDKVLDVTLWPIKTIHTDVQGPQLYIIILGPSRVVIFGPCMAPLYFICGSMFNNITIIMF